METVRTVSPQEQAARMHAVTPHLVCAGATEAIEFYRRAFDAEVMFLLPMPDGKVANASLCINGSSVMLVDENVEMGMTGPKHLKGTPVTIHLMVDDVDAWFGRAVDAGATVVMPVADMFWGDRYGVVEDPFGHKWSLATHQRDVSAEEMRAEMAKLIC